MKVITFSVNLTCLQQSCSNDINRVVMVNFVCFLQQLAGELGSKMANVVMNENPPVTSQPEIVASKRYIILYLHKNGFLFLLEVVCVTK